MKKLTEKQFDYLTETIEKLEMDEGAGWDFIMGRANKCCPGDDYADVYNMALGNVKKILLDNLED